MMACLSGTGEYLCRARATHYFYSRFTQNGLAFTPHKMPPKESKPLGTRPADALPYLAPPKVIVQKMAPWDHPSLGSPCWIVDLSCPCPNGRGKSSRWGPDHQLIYSCMGGPDGIILALRARRVWCSPFYQVKPVWPIRLSRGGGRASLQLRGSIIAHGTL